MEAKHDEPAYYIYVVFAYKIINAYNHQNPLKYVVSLPKQEGVISVR